MTSPTTPEGDETYATDALNERWLKEVWGPELPAKVCDFVNLLISSHENYEADYFRLLREKQDALLAPRSESAARDPLAEFIAAQKPMDADLAMAARKVCDEMLREAPSADKKHADTPRTNAEEYAGRVMASFARQLERDLCAALAEKHQWRHEARSGVQSAVAAIPVADVRKLLCERCRAGYPFYGDKFEQHIVPSYSGDTYLDCRATEKLHGLPSAPQSAIAEIKNAAPQEHPGSEASNGPSTGPAGAATKCPKCGLEAKTLLHPFCKHADCPVRATKHVREQGADLLDDGFGNRWIKCKGRCGLEIVRPGKVQCEVDWCPLRASTSTRSAK